MTQGGLAQPPLSCLLYLSGRAQQLKMGYASALAWILFMIILGLTLLQLWGSKKWVYYEEES
jgi:multiple sugar transport system permease protein